MSKLKANGGRTYMKIKVANLIDNPLNSVLFRSPTIKEYGSLVKSIRQLGVKTDAVVYESDGGNYTLLSGHNRKKVILENPDLGIEEMDCVVESAPKNEVEEMLTMVAYNLGRGLSDVWAIKVFGHINQLVCQLRKKQGAEPLADDGDTDESDLRYGFMSDGFSDDLLALFEGINLKGRRTDEVIEEVLGITVRQQKSMLALVDKKYREKLYARVQRVAKIKKSAIAAWEEGFADIARAVECDEITLHAAYGQVQEFVSEIEALEQKKQPKPAKQEKPAKKTKAKAEEIAIEVDDGEPDGGALLRHNRMDSAEVLEYFGISMDDYDDGDVVVLTPDTFAIRAADVCFIISNHDLLEWLTTGA